MSILNAKALFNLFLILWFAYGVWESSHYAYLAKVFPFYVSLILLIVSIINMILDLRNSLKTSTAPGKSTVGSDLSSNWDIPMEEVWKRMFFFLGIIVLAYGSIYVIGYPLTMTLFILLFYKFIAKAPWIYSVIAATAGLGFLALTSKLLGMSWPEGLFVFPWPLG